MTILLKNETFTNNPPVEIYIIINENIITFEIKTGYDLEILIIETMKLLGTTKDKTDKDKNSKNVPHSESTEVILVHYNIVSYDYQQV